MSADPTINDSANCVERNDDADAVLTLNNVTVEFNVGGQTLSAISDVSFAVTRNETIGVVGESGCGKSTLARAILQVPRPTAGSIWFEGSDLTALSGEDLRRVRPRLQMLLQNAVGSLNPRQTVWDSIAAPLEVWRIGTDAERSIMVETVLTQVGIDPARARRSRPSEFSGGQCQRISLARAIALRPVVLVCDEIVSGLDVLVQAQILNLLDDIRALYGLTMLFIGHDLAVVRKVSDRIVVMYLGRICEIGTADQVFARPAHPYTERLLASVPQIEERVAPRDEVIQREAPSPLSPPSGCRFRTLCPRAEDRCATTTPVLREVRSGQKVACHFPSNDHSHGM